MRAVEQLAHRQRRGALGADHAEPLDILRRQAVLQEEEPELLDILGELHGVDRAEPLVDVVEQLHFLADRAAHVRHHAQHVAHVAARIEVCAVGRAIGLGQRRAAPP